RLDLPSLPTRRSSDLTGMGEATGDGPGTKVTKGLTHWPLPPRYLFHRCGSSTWLKGPTVRRSRHRAAHRGARDHALPAGQSGLRSEEHTSELQSLTNL